MKKFTMAMLIALLGAGLATGCGDKDKDDDDVECKADSCAAVENADAVASEKDGDCVCEYTCKTGFKKVEDKDAQAGMKCVKEEKDPSKTCAEGKECCTDVPCANGICNAEGKCEATSCADGKECCDAIPCTNGTCNAEGKCEGGKTCDDGKECCADVPCNGGKVCDEGACKGADDYDHKDCDEQSKDMCFNSNVKVACETGEGSDIMMYIKETCPDNSVCVLEGQVASCKLDNSNVPATTDACDAANEGKKVNVACSGSYDGQGGWGSALTRKCTKKGDKYEWVDEEVVCGTSTSCLAGCPTLGCGSYAFCPTGEETKKECEKDADCKDDKKICSAAHKCINKPEVVTCDDGKECCAAKACSGNYDCVSGKCLAKNGEVCADGSDCVSGYCDGDGGEENVCMDKPTTTPSTGESCSKHADCGAGSHCIDGGCRADSKLFMSSCTNSSPSICVGDELYTCEAWGGESVYASENCDSEYGKECVQETELRASCK